MQTLEIGEPVQLQAFFSDESGTPTNPTAVTLTVSGPDGSTTVFPQGALSNTAVGEWSYDYVPTLAGGYSYRFQGTGIITQGETDYFIVEPVGKSLPFDGPCQPWTSIASVRSCCHSLPASGAADYVSDSVIQSAIDLASSLLYSLTAQQYPGTCSETIRPSSSRDTLGVYAAGWSGLSTYNVPLIDESSLEPRGATYTRVPTIDLLPWWPVTAVTEVKVDGAVVDPSTYQLGEWRFLERLAGAGPNYVNPGWPIDQRLDIPVTQPGTFQVTFLHGQAVPPGGIRAASVLACELLKSCLGQACQLPNRVTQVNRQGVSMTLIDPSMLDKGLTGVWECDIWIRSVNPKGYTGGSAVWTPDVTPPGRRY